MSRVYVKCGSEDFVPSGKYFRCNPCLKEQRRSRYTRNREAITAKNKEWAENNKAKVRDHKKRWRDSNPEAARAMIEAWRKNNRGKVRSYVASRRSSLRKAIPAWADKKEIRTIYTIASDKGLVVDHIVPLVSDRVCGLHTGDNLRCISPELNTRKSNTYWSDM